MGSIAPVNLTLSQLTKPVPQAKATPNNIDYKPPGIVKRTLPK